MFEAIILSEAGAQEGVSEGSPIAQGTNLRSKHQIHAQALAQIHLTLPPSLSTHMLLKLRRASLLVHLNFFSFSEFVHHIHSCADSCKQNL
jgi:hypothetical protein